MSLALRLFLIGFCLLGAVVSFTCLIEIMQLWPAGGTAPTLENFMRPEIAAGWGTMLNTFGWLFFAILLMKDA